MLYVHVPLILPKHFHPYEPIPTYRRILMHKQQITLENIVQYVKLLMMSNLTLCHNVFDSI